MARFGQGLIQGLINPGYELNTTGMMAGGLAGSIAERKEKEQRDAMIGKLMTDQSPQRMRQGAAELFKTDPEAAKALLAQSEKVAKKMEQLTGVSPQTRRIQAEQLGPTRNLTEAQLASLQKNFTPESIDAYSQRAGALVPRPKSETGGGEATSTFASVGNFKDDSGNIYSVTEQRNKQGGIDVVYNPITPNAPNNPEGQLTPIGGAYGVSAGELAGLAGNKKEAEEFSKNKVAAAIQVPELQNTLEVLDQLDSLLSRVDTGGPINIANTAIEGFLGTKSADKGELHVLAGEAMYSRLKPLFGGVISEGERKTIEGLYLSLRKGNPENEGILRALRSETERALLTSNLIRRANSPEEFNTLLDKLYPETASEGSKEVSWGEL
jgi:hypothetical protein